MILTDMQEKAIEEKMETLLNLMGLKGPNFDGTPGRVARMWRRFMEPEPCYFASFPLRDKGGMIAIKDHECWSFCPHHLLPVKYTVKVGYIPDRKESEKTAQVLGLSKLARIADCAMPEMPLQEDLAEMIARPIINQIQPKGVGVVIHGEHLCMRMRGVESRCAAAVTTFMWGIFREDSKTREEFLAL